MPRRRKHNEQLIPVIPGVTKLEVQRLIDSDNARNEEFQRVMLDSVGLTPEDVADYERDGDGYLIIPKTEEES